MKLAKLMKLFGALSDEDKQAFLDEVSTEEVDEVEEVEEETPEAPVEEAEEAVEAVEEAVEETEAPVEAVEEQAEEKPLPSYITKEEMQDMLAKINERISALERAPVEAAPSQAEKLAKLAAKFN